MPVKPTHCLLLKALLLTFACSFICHAQAPQARTRQQFAALMSRVSPEMSRDEVEAILRILDETPSYSDGWGYNPRGIIRAVNALQPLGKEKALAAVAEYLPVSPGSFDAHAVDGMFLVLRTLFEIPVPPGHMPGMAVGQPSPPGPEDQTKIPRFPIYIQDDIPFLMVSGYSLFGQAEDPRKHLNYFREHGVIRSLPLVPPPDPAPSISRILDALSNNGIGPDEAPEYDMLFNQMLWLLDSVYEVEGDSFRDKMFWATSGDREKAVAAVSRLKLRWDVKKQDYTFADGTTPQIDRPGPYRRNIWKPEIPELDLTLTIERISRKAIEVGVRWTGGKQELHDRSAGISVYNASDRSLPIAQFKLEYLENGSRWTGAKIKYGEGQVLIAVFEGAKTTVQSPEYKP